MEDAAGLGQLTVSREGGRCLGGPRRHRCGAELPGLLQPPRSPSQASFALLSPNVAAVAGAASIQNNPSLHGWCFRPSQVMGGESCYRGESFGL